MRSLECGRLRASGSLLDGVFDFSLDGGFEVNDADEIAVYGGVGLLNRQVGRGLQSVAEGASKEAGPIIKAAETASEGASTTGKGVFTKESDDEQKEK